MKIINMIFLLFATTSMVYAQEPSDTLNNEEDTKNEETSGKVREAGIIFNSFNSFGITYKCGTESSLWRFQTANLSMGSGTGNNRFGIGFRVGHEWRKSLADKLSLKYGADLVFDYQSTASKNDDGEVVTRERTMAPGLGGVIGVNYICHENIVLTASLLPTLSIASNKNSTGLNTSTTQSQTSNDVNFNLNSSAAFLTVAYRF